MRFTFFKAAVFLSVISIVCSNCKKDNNRQQPPAFNDSIVNMAPYERVYFYAYGIPEIGDTIFFRSFNTKNVKSLIWDFGDGTRSFDSTPYHIYKRAGVYNVTLKVDNDYEAVVTLNDSIWTVRIVDSIHHPDLFRKKKWNGTKRYYTKYSPNEYYSLINSPGCVKLIDSIRLVAYCRYPEGPFFSVGPYYFDSAVSNRNRSIYSNDNGQLIYQHETGVVDVSYESISSFGNRYNTNISSE